MFPQHKYAERAVIGLGLVSDENIYNVIKLDCNLFFEPKNRVIFLALKKAYSKIQALTWKQLSTGPKR